MYKTPGKIIGNPIYFEIDEGGKVFTKMLGAQNYYEGVLYLWLKEGKNKAKSKVISVGAKFRPEKDDFVRESECKKYQVFYNKDSLIIDDFEVAEAAIKKILMRYCLKGQLVKPIIIVNIFMGKINGIDTKGHSLGSALTLNFGL